MSTKFFARRLQIAAVFLSLAVAAEAGAAQFRVCTLGFHGPEEVAVFESRLPATDFDFIDLSPPSLLSQLPAAGTPDTAAALSRDDRGWLQASCRSDLKCDVVVLSAEFAGKFFGRHGRSLSLQEMEEASCQARCDGLFHAPREVFLLACNTLATKDQDMRSPATYLQVLLDHGFQRSDAERVVAMRYGPLGPTFREALRRIFMGVPRIYGFSSVAPTGQYTGPMLERYFSAAGDYRGHVERVRHDSPPNRKLAAAFAGTSMVETSGLSPSEPAAPDRDLVCALYDEHQTVTRRLEIVNDFMDRNDLLAFVPSVQTFINRHPPHLMSAGERQLFEKIKGNVVARDRIVALVYQLDASALRLELGHFAVEMGWLAREKFRALVIETAKQLLRRPLQSEVVDVMCEVPKHASVGDQFGSADLPDALFRDAEGIRLVSCLAPPGGAVSARVAGALGTENPELRVWAAHTLTRRLPLPDGVLLAVMAHINDPSPDVAERLRWIFKAQRPLSADVRRVLAARAPDLAAQLGPAPTPTQRSVWE